MESNRIQILNEQDIQQQLFNEMIDSLCRSLGDELADCYLYFRSFCPTLDRCLPSAACSPYSLWFIDSFHLRLSSAQLESCYVILSFWCEKKVVKL